MRLLLLVTWLGGAFGTANFTGLPIILIPGDGGSQIWARLNKTTSPHYVCYKKTNYWFPLWLNFEELAPLTIDCFVDNMKLIYDNVTHKTHNTPGVETKVLDFGNTTGVEYLDPAKLSAGDYFGTMVQKAMSWGYSRGKNIRGAPFDFRKAPNELGDFYGNLSKLIEETYYANGNKKVVLVAHSFGNNALLYFLTKKDQAWKEKFISKFISAGAPWLGSMKVMLVLASGYNMDHWRFVIPPSKARIEQRSMPSTPFMLPSPLAWNENEVLVETPNKNYSTRDYKEFFQDLKFMDGYEMYLDTKDLLKGLPPPGVETHCFYGTGQPTPDRFVYAKGYFPDYQPSHVNGDGDGTVNLRSVLGCKRWIGKQKQPVKLIEMKGEEHLGMLQSDALISAVKRLAFSSSTRRTRRIVR